MVKTSQDKLLEILELIDEFVMIEKERLKKGEAISKDNQHRLEIAQERLRDFLNKYNK